MKEKKNCRQIYQIVEEQGEQISSLSAKMSEICTLSSQLSEMMSAMSGRKDKYASLGYIRAMKSGSRVFIKALIDSGNLFGHIMSKRQATSLNIKYKPYTNKAGTAVANQKVHVLGPADPFDLILEGLEDPIKIQPYVICSLSHDLNLGEQFL